MIFLILAVAFLLRAVGVWFGLPHLYHQDEPIVVNHALAYASFDFNPHFFKIPPLVSYLLFGIYGVYFLWMKLWAGASVHSFAISFFKDPTFFYLLGRVFFGTILGTASVGALFVLARRNLSRQGALAAAAFLAMNYLHVRDSHYIYADIPMVFSMLMAFVAMSDHSERGDLGSFIASCVWCGVAIAFKYIAAVMMFPLLFAMLKKSGLRHALAAAALTCSVYLILNPFSIADRSFFIQEIHRQAAAESAMPLWHHWNYSIVQGMGFLAAALGVTGLLWDFFQDSKRRWLWSFPFAYYAALTAFSQPYERYAIPIIPFLCLGCGSLLSRIGKVRMQGRAGLVFVVFLAALMPGLVKSLYLDRLMIQSDTRTLAKQWIESNLPAGTSIALDDTAFSPRLLQTPEQLKQKMEAVSSNDPHVQEKKIKIESMLDAQKEKPAYTVYYLNRQNIDKSSFLMWSPFIEPRMDVLRENNIEYVVRHLGLPKAEDSFDRNLLDASEKVATFSPYKNPAKIFTDDEWANTAFPFRSRELYSRTRPGPVIEIYRLKPKS